MGIANRARRAHAEGWVVIEPPRGSVVLTESTSGTAWQRHYADGLWHSTTGRTLPWAELGLRQGQPKFRVLIYTPPTEED